MTSKNLKAALFSLLSIASLAVYTIGCSDDPSSLGLKFIPPGETTGVRIFDSYIDTLPITSINHRYYVNTSGSANMMVGKSGNYDSKMLLQVGGFGDTHDSATVVSAKLFLKYKNYYFPQTDSLGQIGFDIYKVEQSLNFSNITYDSVTSSTFGNVSQGSFTGTPTADLDEIEITLSNTLAKDWLEYAADTAYSVKNFGIALTPNGSSACIKGFYSQNNPDSVKPRVEIIFTKNGDTDTISTISSSSLTLSNTSFTPSAETFNLQAGVSFVQQMSFDLSHFPSSATINDVQLYLTLDSANCNFSKFTTYSYFAQFITDSAGLKSELYSFAGTPTGSNGQYVMRLVAGGLPSPFARWLTGAVNYGLLLFAGNQTVNLDRYVFYSETASDPAKRPRVVIKYTPRVIP